MKGQLKILILGDKDTGKSSIISTYVSRYFPEEVPSLMTDAIIPPGSTSNMSDVAITIMDSSALFGDREVLKQKIRMADTIISLYDVTRPETIDSLESLWLPLIRDVYAHGNSQEQPGSAAVLVVGNKKDRIGEHEESRLQIEEERMKNILRGFPFVVACYRCSAKLIDVDQIFYECELAVEFPLTPIFDTNKSEFTGVCKVAFSRIFRSFDADQDGRLSDEELCALQERSFGAPLRRDEVVDLREAISKSIPGGMDGGLITLKGLMGMLRLFIERGQQQIPWTMLTQHGYESEPSFHLEVPEEILDVEKLSQGESFELSEDGYKFLNYLAVNAQLRRTLRGRPRLEGQIQTVGGKSEVKVIRWNDLSEMLSVISTVSHPWSFPPLCQDDYEGDTHIFLLSDSRPSLHELPGSPSESRQFSSWQQSSDLTVDTSGSAMGGRSSEEGGSEVEDGEAVFCSVDAWIAHWQMLAIHRPMLVQTLLYRLGYIEREDLGLSITSRQPYSYHTDPRSVIHVCLLGAAGVGKADIVRVMSGLTGGDVVGLEAMMTSNVDMREVANKYPSHVLQRGYDCDFSNENGNKSLFIHGSCSTNLISKSGNINLNPRVDIVFTAVPYDLTTQWFEDKGYSTYDLAIMVLKCSGSSRSDDEEEGTILTDDENILNHEVEKVPSVVEPKDSPLGKESTNKAEIDINSTDVQEKISDLLLVAQQLEALLPAHIPRVYVTNQSDLTGAIEDSLSSSFKCRGETMQDNELQVITVEEYLQSHQLHPLLRVSSVTGEGIDDLKQTILHIVSNPDLGIPFSLRKKKNDYFIPKVVVGLGLVTIAVITAFYLFPNEKKNKKSGI
mmetsp:Transcript_29111/g.27901  ORF Transcript_29111/g.27901 Transcript_29111/m.27901 type:complete len:843 (-) Transcript_29111:134-2662(-)